jgi:hypothetical protein
LSLVLDCVNSSEGSPVLGGWDSFGGEDGWFSYLNVLWGSETEEFFVFFIGPGGHEVVTNGESVVLVGVDFFVFGSLGSENFLSEGVLFSSSVRESVFGNVVEEVNGGVLVFFAEILESKGESGFAE